MVSFFKLYESISGGYSGGYNYNFSDFWQISHGYEAAYNQIMRYINSGREPDAAQFGQLVDAFLKQFKYFDWTVDYIMANQHIEEINNQLRAAVEELKHALEMYNHAVTVVNEYLKRLGKDGRRAAIAVFKNNAAEASKHYAKLEERIKEASGRQGYDQLPATSAYGNILSQNVNDRKAKAQQAALDKQAASYKTYRRFDALRSAKPDEKLAAAVANTSQLAWPDAWGDDVEKYVNRILRAAQYTPSMKEYKTLSEKDREQIEQAISNMEAAAATAKQVLARDRYGGEYDEHNHQSANRYYEAIKKFTSQLQTFVQSLPQIGGPDGIDS